MSQQDEDIYPPCVVQEDPGGIQGACLYYTERKDVNSLIRTDTHTPRLTLQEALTQSVHTHTQLCVYSVNCVCRCGESD